MGERRGEGEGVRGDGVRGERVRGDGWGHVIVNYES